MRLFLGTAIPSLVAKELAGLATGHMDPPIWRIAPLAQWHITALFIGERTDGLVPAVSAAVARVAATIPAFTVYHGRLMTMPKDGPSMLWVRFQPSRELTALHRALAQATGTGPSVHRPYWPHITLARAKNGRPLPLEGPEILGSLVIDHLTLFRSLPTPEGSVHEPLASWPLTGTGPIAPAEED